MAGNADEKIFLLATRIHTPPYFLNWQTVLTEMHAAGALRERNVQAIVYKNSSSSGTALARLLCAPKSLTCEQHAFAPGEIFFTKLNPIDSGERRRFSFVQKPVTGVSGRYSAK